MTKKEGEGVPNVANRKEQKTETLPQPLETGKLNIEGEDVLQNLRITNLDRVIIGNLNVNSIAGKFDELKLKVENRVDILILTETKLDDSFPTAQFQIDGYKCPYRQDRNRNEGGVFMSERIFQANNTITFFPDVVFQMDDHQGPIESLFIEIKLRK